MSSFCENMEKMFAYKTRKNDDDCQNRKCMQFVYSNQTSGTFEAFFRYRLVFSSNKAKWNSILNEKNTFLNFPINFMKSSWSLLFIIILLNVVSSALEWCGPFLVFRMFLFYLVVALSGIWDCGTIFRSIFDRSIPLDKTIDLGAMRQSLTNLNISSWFSSENNWFWIFSTPLLKCLVEV